MSIDDPRDLPGKSTIRVTKTPSLERGLDPRLRAQVGKITETLARQIQHDMLSMEPTARVDVETDTEGQFRGGGCPCHGGRVTLTITITAKWRNGMDAKEGGHDA